jgi:hypothetical protein
MLRRCVIVGNVSDAFYFASQGAGVYAYGPTVIEQCTIVTNSAEHFGKGGIGGVFSPSGTAIVRNSILWGNSGEQVAASTSFSCVEGGYTGQGNINADPLFFDAAGQDFRLLPNSPCIDAGDPLSDPDVDGTIVDMGAIPFDHFPVCDGVQTKLTAVAAFDHVGRSLAASGPYVLAGVPDVDGPGFESGAASIVYRDGEEWIELPQLTASDEAADALFGHAVALHDGVALVGARGASSGAGAAYVFRQQSDGSWAEEAKLVAADAQPGDWLGSRVAIEGEVAAAAALHADAPGADSGAVYVFRDTGSGWLQEQRLTGLDTAAGDQFGKGLALSGGRILVGAYGDDDAGADSGSAYVFRNDGGTWTQEAKLTASDAAANALFGNEVALDGDVAVVAARGANGVGAVYVFRRSGTTWSQEAKLSASTPFSGAELGSAVDIVGDRILVGVPLDDSGASDAGAAYLFEFDGAAWIETAKYTLPEAAPGDHLGSAVALSGGYAMVGAEWADDPELDSGELWAFPLPGTCQPQITSVQPTSAQFPEAVTAAGLFLGQTQTVLVDGVAANLIGATDFAVTYEPQPGAPGHVALEASGLDGTAVSEQQMHPSLEASTTGIGGTVDVLLDNGEEGLYALAFATGTFPAPLPITSPPTWYGVILDVTGPVFTASIGAFATEDPVSISLPVPNSPSLSGLVLHFQAWCQQGFFGAGVSYSFTNEGAVTL